MKINRTSEDNPSLKTNSKQIVAKIGKH